MVERFPYTEEVTGSSPVSPTATNGLPECDRRATRGKKGFVCRGKESETMNVASLADVKARFSEYIKQLQTSPVIVTQNGKPIAVIMGISDEDDLERVMLAISPKFQAFLDKAEKRIQETGGLSHEDVWAQIETKV